MNRDDRDRITDGTKDGSRDHPHVLLGAFVLGGLTDEDHRTFSEHLRACDRCQQELGQVSGLGRLLDLADPAVLAVLDDDRDLDDGVPVRGAPASVEGAPRGADGGLDRLLDELARRRRRRRALGGLMAAAVAALLVVGGAWVGPRVTTADAPPTVHVTAAGPAGSTARADVALVTRGWGTQVEVACRDMPTDGELLLWLVDDDGHATSVASWRATRAGYATVTGATSLSPNQIRAVEVRTATGRVIASATT